MKASELRIGNYLQIENMGELAQVCSISNLIDESISVFYYQEGKNRRTFHCIERFKPILLTEEWLLKLGAKESDYHAFFFKINTETELGIIVMSDGCYPQLSQAAELSYQDDNYISLERIKWVHELQNLFYVLTNQELTINE